MTMILRVSGLLRRLSVVPENQLIAALRTVSEWASLVMMASTTRDRSVCVRATWIRGETNWESGVLELALIKTFARR